MATDHIGRPLDVIRDENDMTGKFKKEQRYVVLKIKDIVAAGLTPDEIEAFNEVCDKVALHRNQAGNPPLECVVVEADWRCYSTVWRMVEGEHLGNLSVEWPPEEKESGNGNT